MQINPYLSFNGSCEEALQFYCDVFKGEVAAINRYEGAPMPIPDNYKDKIMHATMTFDGNTLMMCDAMPGGEVKAGTNFSIFVNIMQIMDMEQTFNRMAEGGTITMPLQDTFWGARFGTICDKFGVNWMFNCDLN